MLKEYVQVLDDLSFVMSLGVGLVQFFDFLVKWCRQFLNAECISKDFELLIHQILIYFLLLNVGYGLIFVSIS